MNKATAAQSSGSLHKAAHKKNDVAVTIEAVLPNGSWQRTAAGVAAAAGGGLIAAALLGVGPAAIAGAAGYLAYRGIHAERKANGARQKN